MTCNTNFDADIPFPLICTLPLSNKLYNPFRKSAPPQIDEKSIHNILSVPNTLKRALLPQLHLEGKKKLILLPQMFLRKKPKHIKAPSPFLLLCLPKQLCKLTKKNVITVYTTVTSFY